MSAEIASDPTTADRENSKRTRRALPITKRIARNGKVSYTFQIDACTKPDGSRDRRRYTYTTLAEARRNTLASRPRRRQARWSGATS
jgi:hypothetical protein